MIGNSLYGLDMKKRKRERMTTTMNQSARIYLCDSISDNDSKNESKCDSKSRCKSADFMQKMIKYQTKATRMGIYSLKKSRSETLPLYSRD